MTSGGSTDRGKRPGAASSRPSVSGGAKGKAPAQKRAGTTTRKASSFTARRAPAPSISSRKQPAAPRRSNTPPKTRSSSKRGIQSNASARSAQRMRSSQGLGSSSPKALSQHNAAAAAGSAVADGLGRGIRAILSNRIATIVAIVLLVLVVGGVWDTAANWGKAYGNVSVAGIDVGGKNAGEIDAALRSTLGPRISQAHVTVYASDEARDSSLNGMTDEEKLAHAEQIAQAEQISVEQAVASITSWPTDALSLKAEVPYDQLVEEALAVGRGNGGILSRLGLLFMNHEVEPALDFDSGSLESLASTIDRTIGDPRSDATVSIGEGVASPVEGHDGRMVNRDWFAGEISKALVSTEDAPSFVASVEPAPSRTTYEQAVQASAGINRALEAGAVFSYGGSEWTAYGYDIGLWTRVETVQEEDGSYAIGAHIDTASAIPAVVSGAGAAVKSDNVTVDFGYVEGMVIVRTSGPGNIPEVAPAVDELNEALYGADGIAWNPSAAADPVRIGISESDAPAALTLDQAIDSGIVTVIGEYTTEFSNSEGTENRNHNIKLAADILNNSIVDANGGTWHFNDRSGDTNEEAGFWAAGSIIDNEYVDSIGGGICQVATTIFNAVYEAGLPIDMRFNHTLYIASYPTGRDAAVSYPDLDLWWTNDLPSEVLLQMSYTDTTLTAKLYSVYTGRTVSTETGPWSEGAKYGTTFEEDPDLGKDEYYTKTTGENGSNIWVTRTVHDEAGGIISEQTFESHYDPKNEVIVVGPGTDTKKLERKVDDAATTEQVANDEG